MSGDECGEDIEAVADGVDDVAGHVWVVEGESSSDDAGDGFA